MMTIKGKVKFLTAGTAITFAACILTCSAPFVLMAVDTMVSSQGTVLSASIHSYYKSLPSARKTVLTHLTEHLMICTIAVFCHYLAVSLFTKLFPQTAADLLNWSPNLMTSIASFEVFAFFGMGLVNAIIGLRIFARLKS